jgi:hypothetical protein
MKQTFTLLILLNFCFAAEAQVMFSDDFESYNAGDFIDATSNDWATWGNAPGTATDARVSDERASSGNNSLKIFASSGSGGPMDILLPFKQKFTSGRFIQTMKIYIENGNEAYFNYQGEVTEGQTWTLNGFFRPNGTLDLTNSANQVVLSTSYNQNEWVEFMMDINLTLNIWNVSINGECVGSFTNSNTAVASLNLYPINGNSTFFVDDVTFEHQLMAPEINIDLGVSNISFDGGRLAGTTAAASYQITNNGVAAINDAELSIEANGATSTKELTGLGLEPGESMTITMDDDVTLLEGDNVISVTVVSVDGIAADDEACNDRSVYNLRSVTPAPGKGVLIEEATGTWCPWCVRGTVFMDRLSHTYEGYFIPIAVHNNDPMEIGEYDSYITGLPGFGGFPSAAVNRDDIVDPSNLENPFLADVRIGARVNVDAGATFDENTRELKVTAYLDFQESTVANYHVNLVLTEDGVTGTGSGYDQANAYAGGANGEMGGYELLPSPVPASQMVYDHVARAFIGLNASDANMVEGPFEAGDKRVVNFTYTVPAEFNTDNMYIIPIVMRDNTYENAKELAFNDALSTGTTNVHNITTPLNDVKVFPNPASTISNFEINLEQRSTVIIELIDATGKIIAKANHGEMKGKFIVPVKVAQLNNGVYLARVITDEGISLKKIIVQN